MKKQYKKKPRGGSAKKRKKPDARDKLRIALAAAVLIALAAACSLTARYIQTANEEIAAQQAAAQAPAVIEAPTPAPAKPATQEAAQQAAAQQAAAQQAAAQQAAAQQAAAQVEDPPAAAETIPASPQTAAALEPPRIESQPLPSVPAVPAVVSAAYTGSISGGIIERPPPSRGTLVFVIDDAGHNLRELEPFLNFPGPITIAVLPGLRYSEEAARRIRAAGKELILHQPMESIRGHDPGPRAIRAGMDRDEIRRIIKQNLDEIGPVAGMNNHEGSRISMDEEAMETILSLCRELDIPFLDSRTIAETAAPKVAERLGMIIAERDVFLDNYPERESIRGYINTGLLLAERKGSAIMIGHIWSPELAPLLMEMFEELQEQGYTFSSVSEIINKAKQ